MSFLHSWSLGQKRLLSILKNVIAERPVSTSERLKGLYSLTNQIFQVNSGSKEKDSESISHEKMPPCSAAGCPQCIAGLQRWRSLKWPVSWDWNLLFYVICTSLKFEMTRLPFLKLACETSGLVAEDKCKSLFWKTDRNPVGQWEWWETQPRMEM